MLQRRQVCVSAASNRKVIASLFSLASSEVNANLIVNNQTDVTALCLSMKAQTANEGEFRTGAQSCKQNNRESHVSALIFDHDWDLLTQKKLSYIHLR